MYKAFYGLREKPFNLTPDPRFLYLSEKHKEAFAHLLYGIRSRSGFVMVTGEIGTGKTTICRNLLNQLDEDTEVAFIFNPMLSPLELLRKIVSEFGIDARGANALELTEELNEYLLEAAAKGKNCVLLIDEAQNLDPQVLEQIRLLSNLETETEKLLQIVLIGQPELGEKLELHELRQLNQRITARYHLKPLSEKEVLQYVAYRLHVAGGRRTVKFARPAVRAVYKISKGTPRVINAICDRALLIGFTRETHTITKGIIYRAYREIRGDVVFGRRAERWNFRQWAFHPVTPIIALCIAAAIFLNSPTLQSRVAGFTAQMAAALRTAEPSAPAPGRNIAEAMVRNETPEDTLQSDLLATRDAPAAPGASAVSGETAPPATEREVTHATAPRDLKTDLEALLAATGRAESDAAALNALLTVWGKPAGALPATLDDAALDRVLRGHAWSYERLQPGLDQLIALDLPALVKVMVGGEARWVALTGATGDTLTVTTGNGAPVPAAKAALEAIYAAEAIVPWSDPAPSGAALREGHESAAVAELKQKLHQLERLRRENASKVYDLETATAIKRIQAETSLEVDGIAGRQVRMVLGSWLKAPGTPGLANPTPVSAAEALARQVPPKTPAPAAKKALEPSAAPEPPAEVTTPAEVQPPAAAPEPEITPEPETAAETPARTPEAPVAAATEQKVAPEPETAAETPVEPPEAPVAVATEPRVAPEPETTAQSPTETPEAPVAATTEPRVAPEPETTAETSTKTPEAPVAAAPEPENAPEPETTAETPTENPDPAPVTLTNLPDRDSGSGATDTAAPADDSPGEERIVSRSGTQIVVKELSDPGSLPPEAETGTGEEQDLDPDAAAIANPDDEGTSEG